MNKSIAQKLQNLWRKEVREKYLWFHWKWLTENELTNGLTIHNVTRDNDYQYNYEKIKQACRFFSERGYATLSIPTCVADSSQYTIVHVRTCFIHFILADSICEPNQPCEHHWLIRNDSFGSNYRSASNACVETR